MNQQPSTVTGQVHSERARRGERDRSPAPERGIRARSSGRQASTPRSTTQTTCARFRSASTCARSARASGRARDWPNGGIELVVDAQEASIATEKAVALSLVVNELVTNSFKYAFPEESTPGTARVVVSLERHDDGLVLSVADNGGGTRSKDVLNDEDADEASSRGIGSGLGFTPRGDARTAGRSEDRGSLMTVDGVRGSRSVSRRETSVPWGVRFGSFERFGRRCIDGRSVRPGSRRGSAPCAWRSSRTSC